MPKHRPDQTRFLNVDLDIRAKSGLRTLLTAMEPVVTVLNFQPRRLLSVELKARQPRTINEAVRLFFELVDSVEPSTRLVWDRCESWCLQIGIQAATTPHEAQFDVSEEAIEMLGRMRAHIGISIYGASGRTASG
jgi:hypothetical protein